MDRRKIEVEKGKVLYDALGSDELNLELANNLENLFELREVVKMKARQHFQEQQDKKRIFTFVKGADSLETTPKFAYTFTLVGWFILYQTKRVNKMSLLYALFSISIFYNMRRQKYCKLQKEYTEYEKLNKIYHQIVVLKKRSMTLETFLFKTFGVDFNKFPSNEKFKYIKYEYLY